MCFGSRSRITTSADVPPFAGATLGTEFGQSLVHGPHQLLVFQHLVGVSHLRFAQISYLFRDRTIVKLESLPARLNHGNFSRCGPAFGSAFAAATASTTGRGSTWQGYNQSPRTRPTLSVPDGQSQRARVGHIRNGSCRLRGPFFESRATSISRPDRRN
jgi:hypothetical protein